MPFTHLVNSSQLLEISQASAHKPQMIFKHSTRCSISAAAKYRLESAQADLTREMDVYYLDLILHRDVSNEIASYFGARHESPQVLVIDQGKVVLNVTHYDIEAPVILDKAKAISQGAQPQSNS